MIIYRLEHKEKKVGPFQPMMFSEDDKVYYTLLDFVATADRFKNNFPSIWDDIPQIREISRELEKWNCGTISEDQFFGWFSFYWLDKLESLGFEIKEFEVDEKYILFGKKQVLFRREFAKEINHG